MDECCLFGGGDRSGSGLREMMERPIDSHWLPSTTLFSQVLGPPIEGQETTLVAIGFPNKMEC